MRDDHAIDNQSCIRSEEATGLVGLSADVLLVIRWSIAFVIVSGERKMMRCKRAFYSAQVE